MCKEWEEYQPFRVWALANGYTEKKSLARSKQGAGFCPSNCRWVAKSINASMGEDNPTKRKLNSKEVAEIRASTGSMKKLARSYNVSVSTIFCVIHYKTYKEEYSA